MIPHLLPRSTPNLSTPSNAKPLFLQPWHTAPLFRCPRCSACTCTISLREVTLADGLPRGMHSRRSGVTCSDVVQAAGARLSVARYLPHKRDGPVCYNEKPIVVPVARARDVGHALRQRSLARETELARENSNWIQLFMQQHDEPGGGLAY
jgi:hypothetical protein